MKTSKTTKKALALVVLLAPASFCLADSPAPADAMDHTYTGRVTFVDSQEHLFTVRGWLLSQKQFSLGANCTFAMVDKSNASAADLRAGEKVTVHYQTASGVHVADRIEQQALRCEGTVTAIDPASHVMTLHRRGTDRPMQIADGCRVILKNDRSGALSDIRVGDHVTVIYETPGGMPSARQIAQTSADFVGAVTAIDLEEKTVKAKDTSGTMKFSLADNCAIVVDGKINAKLSELRPDERLDFNYETLNGVNVVNRITPAPPEAKRTALTTLPANYQYP